MSGARLEQPRLLPAMLVPPPDGADPDGPSRRSTRDWLVDFAFFLIAGVVGSAGLMTEGSRADMPQSQLIVSFALGLLACVLLCFRRRWPVGVALATIALGAYSTFAAPAGVLALFSVAVHRRFAAVAAVTGFGLVVLPITLALHPDTSGPVGLAVGLNLALGAAVIAWGMFVRARRQLVLSLRDRTHRAESEQQLRVEQARHQERAQIAREMHDVLAHRISLLSMHAGALEFRPDAPPAEIERAAGVVRASAHQALEDLREVIGVLREDEADAGPERPQPALANLPDLLDESRAAGMHVRSECRVEGLETVPAGVGRNAYRIVQEGLTNARKHAHGAAVDVALDGGAGEGLTVEVRNRLPLADPGPARIPGTGTGLIGLAERASLAGGRLDHGRTPDGDFRLRAWLPWPA